LLRIANGPDTVGGVLRRPGRPRAQRQSADGPMAGSLVHPGRRTQATCSCLPISIFPDRKRPAAALSANWSSAAV